MTTETQRQRKDLSDKIVALEQRYRTTPLEQKSMNLVAGALEEWVSYKSSIEELYGGKASIQIRKRELFLSQVKADFCRDMDEIMQEYETHPHKNAEYVKQVLENARRYWQLYTQGGLHRVGIEEGERKHFTYSKFIARVKGDLESLNSPQASVPPIRHQNTYQTVYEGLITIPAEVGSATPFHLLLLTDRGTNVYWAVLRGHGAHSPDDTYFPVGKKLKDLTADDIALVLANAYMREQKKANIRIPYEPQVLAIEIPTIAPGLVTQIYESVRNGKK